MSPRRTDADRQKMEAQTRAVVGVREATANYLAAHGVPADVAYMIGAQQTDETFMEEVFNHLDDQVDQLLTRDDVETYRDVEAQIGGTE